MWRVTVFALFASAIPTLAYANVGLPMIALLLPPAWTLLVPIVVLEAAVGSLKFGVPFGRALKAQAFANALSTIIGLPLAWCALAVLQLSCCGTALGLETPARRIYAVTVQAPWLIPYEHDFWWMIPAASVVLASLFCALSIVLEYPIVKRFAGSDFAATAWPWVLRANVLSYLTLVVTMVVVRRWSWLANSLGSLFLPVLGFLASLVFKTVGAIVGARR